MTLFNSDYLVTLVERKSGYALVGHIPRATKENFRLEAERLLALLPKHLKRSPTLDNGREMNDYKEFERHTSMTTYFAHPCHSWERGTNENLNGLLRQFFPKGSDFSTITDKQVDLAVSTCSTLDHVNDTATGAQWRLLKPYLRVAI